MPRILAIGVLTVCGLAACGGDDDRPPPAQNRWTALGEVPATASTVGDHTPLVVSEGEIFVGTRDGVWHRALSGDEEWSGLGPSGLTVYALRADPEDPQVLLAGGAPETFDQPTFYRSEDRGQTWTPASQWYIPPRPEESVPISGLALLPGNSRVLYGTVNADMVISTDGGMTWALPDGRTEEFFGYPCVITTTHTDPPNLVSGCEALLDVATVSSLELDPADPFDLTRPGPWSVTFDVLSNRRPNSLAHDPERPETLYAGVEGALLAITGNEVSWIFEGGEPETPWPYAYITAIWLDPDDPGHLIFGGKPNGDDSRLSLFETDDHGETLTMLEAPREFTDPAVVQIVPSGEGDLVVLISDGEGPDRATDRRLFVYRLETR